jgi:hypothetical protein
MATLDFSGKWVGHYRQHDQSRPIMAQMIQSGSDLTGSMRDLETDWERSVFDVAAEAGLPPGADEQIIARLREIVPDSPAGPIRYVTHLPPDSVLEGKVRGSRVYWLKRYQGAHFVGYRVGDQVLKTETVDHAVHYEGLATPDGGRIEGIWWIDANPALGTSRNEGSFVLRRE